MLDVRKAGEKLILVSEKTDLVIGEFNSEEELRLAMAKEEMYIGKLKAIRAMIVKPLKRAVNPMDIINGELSKNREENKEYQEFLQELSHCKNNEEYFIIIDKQYKKLLGAKL